MEVHTANLQVLKPVARRNGRQLTFSFQVLNCNDDTARMVRAIVVLPPNLRVEDVFVEEIKTGFKGYDKVSEECNAEQNCKCSVYWNSSVSVNRPNGKLTEYFDSNVQIDLAYLNVHETANIRIVANVEPLDNDTKIFGAFVYGSVPDLDPTSNYRTASC